jgi:hypothetical protein
MTEHIEIVGNLPVQATKQMPIRVRMTLAGGFGLAHL